MKTSWWHRAAALLIALLLSSMLYFMWTSFNVAAQIRQTVIKENSSSAALWVSDTESRLTAIYEHIHELLLTLHNSNQLPTGTPIMNATTKKKILDMMEDKLFVIDDADAFFVFDTENSFFLFQAKTGLGGREAHALKLKLREDAEARATAYRNLSWQTMQVGQKQYFTKGVRLGKYIVGAVSSTELYHIDTKFSVLGSDTSFLLLTDSDVLFLGGDQDYSEAVEAESPRFGFRSDRCTVSCDCQLLDATAVLTVIPKLDSGHWNALPILLVVNSTACVGLALLLLRLLRRKVANPTRELMAANQSLAHGDLNFRLSTKDAGSSEFEALYDSFNDMASQITNLRIQAYDLRLQEDENRLTMLRAQIKPHSFLNAITTISNLTYIAEPADVRSYIATFAKFIRYMLNVTATYIPLSDELAHIENYLKMQSARFPGSIAFTTDCSEDTLQSQIPFLMLYTLVENSIKHAMTLYEPLNITIRSYRLDTESFHGICITEEDSGEGFSPEVLEQLREEDPSFTKEHLGLSNVRYTLNLIYHRNDLLLLSNRPEGGARVEIRIPDKEENRETSDL